jgi:glycine/serine hydroxymethyltransferase
LTVDEGADQHVGNPPSLPSRGELDKVFRDVAAAEKRAERMLHLTANETVMSRTARSLLSSPLGDLYFMGGGDADRIVDFQPFTFRGMPEIQKLVSHAEAALCSTLSASAVTLKMLSGLNAMTCAILALTDPGDVVMTVDLEHGGHYATRPILERTGRRHVSTAFDLAGLRFDVDKLAAEFHRSGARAFYMDVSYYLNPHNLRDIRAALGDDALIVYDASHTLGLIMGGKFQNPLVEGADVISANTHKTLPGPQKGLLAFRSPEVAERALATIGFLLSSTHTAATLALATTVMEMAYWGRPYAENVIANANALGRALETRGFTVRHANTGRVSENHQVHVMTEARGGYRDLYTALTRNDISLNFDQALGRGIYARIGTTRVTRAGMDERDMTTIADLVARAVTGDDVLAEVHALTSEFQSVKYSFDSEV